MHHACMVSTYLETRHQLPLIGSRVVYFTETVLIVRGRLSLCLRLCKSCHSEQNIKRYIFLHWYRQVLPTSCPLFESYLDVLQVFCPLIMYCCSSVTMYWSCCPKGKDSITSQSLVSACHCHMILMTGESGAIILEILFLSGSYCETPTWQFLGKCLPRHSQWRHL